MLRVIDNERLEATRIEDREACNAILNAATSLRTSLADDNTDEKIPLALTPAGPEHAPVGDSLLELSKCPDLIVNRGHYFGTSSFQEEPGLSDDNKRALIEYLERLVHNAHRMRGESMRKQRGEKGEK
jgi:hypothetical protein